MIKPVIKYSAALLGIVILGLAALAIIRHYSAEYQARRELEKIVEEYKNDPYGGETPEETLQLFIDALKKDDIDLAVKYFVLERQEEMRKELERTKNDGYLEAFVKSAEELGNKYSVNKENTALYIFESYNAKKELILQAVLIRGPNGLWKIQKL